MTHAYADSRTFSVTLTVANAAGNTATRTVQLPIWQQTWFIGAVARVVVVAVAVVVIMMRRKGAA